jgi:hypothetical protein
MPIKEKSVFTKREFEYESPDGDKYTLVYVEHENREYVEISRLKDDGTPGDKVVWDAGMLREVAEMMAKVKNKPAPAGLPRGLPVPNITDHRFGRAALIERSVNASMQRFDNSVQPIESFDGQSERKAWEQNATGIDRSSEPDIADTPEELSAEGKSPSELTGWQKDALQRRLSPVQKDPNKSIRRIDAGDLI